MVELVVSHSHEAGTLVEGTVQGDGSAEVLKGQRWRWGRSIGCWYLPHSRDRAAQRGRIAALVEALEVAGFAVVVEIDDAARPVAVVEAGKAARAQARAEALEAKAARRAVEAEHAEQVHQRRVESLPAFGEPVKVGHHSEGRHRAALERAHQALGRSVEADRAAEEAERAARTARAATGARYAPDTVARRIERLEAEARGVQRILDGYTTDRGTPYARPVPPATGERRERAEAEAGRLAEEVAYWRQVRAEQIQAGLVGDYSRETVRAGDFVKIGSGWWEVVRANAKTVTLASQGCSTRAPYGTIRDHRRPNAEA